MSLIFFSNRGIECMDDDGNVDLMTRTIELDTLTPCLAQFSESEAQRKLPRMRRAAQTLRIAAIAVAVFALYFIALEVLR